MKVLSILLLVFATEAQINDQWDFDTSSKETVEKYWQKYKLIFEKHYETETENLFRKYIFLDNIFQIRENNEKYAKNLAPFQMGVNDFTDMPLSEIQQSVLGCAKETNETDDDSIRFIPPANVAIPDDVDWRKEGAVTRVKRQKQCKSCYAFAATGALEGQHYLKEYELVTLSEQQIVDCSDNLGCNGGNVAKAFKYIKKNDGIDLEEAYPYENKVGSCRYDPAAKGATDRGVVTVKKRSEQDLKLAVATVGPIATNINVRKDLYKFAGGKVYYNPKCRSDVKHLDHAVLIVGYGTDPTDPNPDYWIVKNSWGKKWGEKGYFRIARNKNNHCGIATKARYPIV